MARSEMTPWFFLSAAGLAAGFIDSILGGGGLITVPALMLRLGVSPLAIGTNKAAAACSVLAASAVYGSGGHVRWRTTLPFALCVGSGAAVGALLSPRFLVPFYPAFLWAGTLACLGTLAFRGRLLSGPRGAWGKGDFPPAAAALGFVCGIYDGAWGPGGGTFMFLILFYGTRLSLIECIAASKISNLASSLLSLGAYASQGQVLWGFGGTLGISLAAGALLGSSMALRHAERVIGPILAAISGLLLWRLFSG